MCFTRHGCCKVKISDQGQEFVNQVNDKSTTMLWRCNCIVFQVNDELCRLCRIQCNMTSAYHPQSNGLDERFDQTLQRQLLKFIESEQNSWDNFWMQYSFHIEYLARILPSIHPFNLCMVVNLVYQLSFRIQEERWCMPKWFHCDCLRVSPGLIRRSIIVMFPCMF